MHGTNKLVINFATLSAMLESYLNAHLFTTYNVEIKGVEFDGDQSVAISFTVAE